MTITQALSLDVARESVVRISAKQFDSNSRYLLITVLESGQEQTIPSASTITLNGRRPDGSSQSFLGEVQDGKAYLKIDDYLLEQYGTVYCSISIIGSDGARLSTLSFRMVVERAESTGWVLMYTAPSALSAGTYHINVGSISYQFTLTQALPVGGCIYFASDYTGAKTVVNGADVETLTLTVGTSGTELIGSDVVNFLTQISAEVSSINEGLDSKADKSAIEENLTAGTSLATIDKSSYTPNTTPYLHRISPSGKRCEYDVIGGTVGWNQLLTDEPEGTTTVAGAVTKTVANHKITLNGTASATGFTLNNKGFNAIAGHKYALLSSAEIPQSTNKYQLYLSGSIGSIYGISHPSIYSANGTGTSTLRYVIYSGATINASFDDPRIIDLTTLLGSTIADYAYQLEQTTAGSGIAWLKSFGFLSKDYYEYCEPTLESVQATARVARGINIYNPTNYVADAWIDASTGAFQNKSYAWRSGYIPVFGNKNYYIGGLSTSHNSRVSYYDADYNYISRSGAGSTGSISFTAPSNCAYIAFCIYGSTSFEYRPQDVCINLSNPTINGTYYPYESHTYPLGNVTLRGIPTLVDGKIKWDGDVHSPSGKVTRIFKYVTGAEMTLHNTSSEGYKTYKINASDAKNAGRVFTNYTQNRVGSINSATVAEECYQIPYSSAGRIFIAISPTRDINSVAFIYELATPTTESTSPFTPIQYTGSTEEFTTDNDVPVGVDAKYYTDLTLPKLPTANGTYTLKCTVTDGTGIVSWVSE